MSRLPSWIPFAAAAALALPAAVAVAAPVPLSGGEAVTYEVTALDGKLLRMTGQGDERLAVGARLAGGDELATGWFSSAELTAESAAARFELRARTRVRLAADRPGVLLVLEKGRLRALFDRLTGGEERERRVETPSAVLAVRGTEYGVVVGRDGATTLVVFEGVVEVTALGVPGGPVSVPAGEALHVRRGEAPGQPFRHGLSPRGWDRGEMPAMGPRSGPPGRGMQGPPARPQGPAPMPKGPPPALPAADAADSPGPG